MKKKENTIILLPAVFRPDVKWTDLPFLVERSLSALLFSQSGGEDSLIYSLLNLAPAINTLRLTLTAYLTHTCPPSTTTDITHSQSRPMSAGANQKGKGGSYQGSYTFTLFFQKSTTSVN